MAVTSIWSVKGWLGKVVIYVENPEKTVEHGSVENQNTEEEEIQGLSDVIAYAVNEEKTKQKERVGGKRQDYIHNENEKIMQQYVSGINCTPVTARAEMLAVKKRYGKDEGIMAFHGYQSFAPGECSPAMAHEIGVKMAEELWGGRFQILVATHLDKAHHLHNHFVVNSVSFIDGLRYHRTNQDYRDMRNVSDRLCREYGLSVIEKPGSGKAKHYGEWKAEQEQKPTYRGMVRNDIEEAIAEAKTEKQFFYYLKEKGYSFKFGKDVTVCPAGRERGLKLVRNFGEEYSMESIRRRILANTKEAPYTPAADVLKKRHKKYVLKLSGDFRCTRKIGGLQGLYLKYCYLLGILPKNRPPVNYAKLHFLLREDLIKMNTISKEARLLCHYRIDTAEQLFLLKGCLQEQMEELVDTRKHLYYKSRSIKGQGELPEVKAEISKMSIRIGKLREEVRLCNGIAVRSRVIEEKMETIRWENRAEKEEKEHEYVRRSR